MNAIDLFCGCGGMTQGLKSAGINVIAGIDIWDKAIESYSKNHNHLALCKDLTTFTPEDLELCIEQEPDIIVGGPPCQGFSMAGRRDTKDPRNSLFMEFYNYITYFAPHMFIMENVMGLLSMKTAGGEKCIDIIMEKLTENYNCNINKLYAKDFEVPQLRRRVLIVGHISKVPPMIPLPNTAIIPVSTVLEPRADVHTRQYLSEKAVSGILRRKAEMKKKGNGFGAQFLDMGKPSYTISARYWKDGYDALVKYDDGSLRRLTVLELKRIQTFPDNYTLIGSKKEQITQIGNAVACRFAYYVGKYIIDVLQ